MGTQSSTRSQPSHKKTVEVFSQSDDDGITLGILRRMQLTNGSFLEFGVGNGLENNTLVLLSHRWSGGRVGGEKLAFKLPQNSRLRYWRRWIDRESIQKLLTDNEFSQLVRDAQVLSFDLDGNDAHFVSDLLESGVHPLLWIQEYNVIIPPKVSWTIDYNPTHKWKKDNYMGASLQCFISMFQKFEYPAVACSVTGANVFFVRNDQMHLFADCPTSVEDIYVGPFYFLQNRRGIKCYPGLWSLYSSNNS